MTGGYKYIAYKYCTDSILDLDTNMHLHVLEMATNLHDVVPMCGSSCVPSYQVFVNYHNQANWESWDSSH